MPRDTTPPDAPASPPELHAAHVRLLDAAIVAWQDVRELERSTILDTRDQAELRASADACLSELVAGLRALVRADA